MHILFTRPLEDCQDMMIQFKLLGHEVSHMPVISIEKKNYTEVNYHDYIN